MSMEQAILIGVSGGMLVFIVAMLLIIVTAPRDE